MRRWSSLGWRRDSLRVRTSWSLRLATAGMMPDWVAIGAKDRVRVSTRTSMMSLSSSFANRALSVSV